MFDVYEVEKMKVLNNRVKRYAFLSVYNKYFPSLAILDQKRHLKKVLISFFNMLFDKDKRA